MTRPTNGYLRWLLLAQLFTIVLVASSGVIYTQRATAAEGRKLCGLVTTLDATYRANPPSTVTGQQVAARMHRLSVDLGCVK